MAYAAQVRNSDNVVVGTWAGGTDQPVAPAAADYHFFTLTEVEYSNVNSKGLVWGGDEALPRWNIVADVLTEIADSRRKAQFVDDADVIISNRIEMTVGDAAKTIKIQALKDDGVTIAASYSGVKKLQVFSSGLGVFWLYATFVSGVATLSLVADKTKELEVPDQGNFNFLNKLKVRVYGTTL